MRQCGRMPLLHVVEMRPVHALEESKEVTERQEDAVSGISEEMKNNNQLYDIISYDVYDTAW